MNERDDRIDILKGIAIYLVVIGHIIGKRPILTYCSKE